MLDGGDYRRDDGVNPSNVHFAAPNIKVRKPSQWLGALLEIEAEANRGGCRRLVEDGAN